MKSAFTEMEIESQAGLAILPLQAHIDDSQKGLSDEYARSGVGHVCGMVRNTCNLSSVLTTLNPAMVLT